MRASLAISTAIFAVAVAQDYPAPPAGGPSTTVLPQEYQTYVPEATTLCFDSTSTITVTKPTTITLTRLRTMTWSEYTTTSCEEESPEETPVPEETTVPEETETPCANSTLVYVPTPTEVLYTPPVANNTQEAPVPVATETGGFVSGAGRSSLTSGALVVVVGVAAFFL